MSALANIDWGKQFDPLAFGMVQRHSPAAFTQVFGQQTARQFPGISLAGAVEEFGKRNGQCNGPIASMSTDDFQKIISDVFHVAGIVQTDLHLPEILKISHQTDDIVNFLPVHRVRGGIFPALKKVLEGSEVTYGEIAEKGESYEAAKFSRLIELTEQAIVNDRLGMLVEPAMRVGEAVIDLKASILAQLVEGNPVLSDGKAVFHADHDNLAAAGSALSVESLSAGVLAMRRQKHVDGERPIDVKPQFLLVPPELETTANQITAEITPASASDVNPFSKSMEIVVDPRLSDPTAWYLFATPSRQLGLEHGVVAGGNDPEVRTEAKMERHTVMTRVSCDFGAGWIDHRGAYKNPGE